MPTIYLTTDNVIEIPELTDGITGAFVNTATVECTLYDQADVEITGESWPLSMGYVAASDGIYRATLKDTLGFTAGQLVRAIVTADDGADRLRTWTADYYVQRG